MDAVWIASADAAGEAWVVVCSFSGRRRRIRTRKKKKRRRNKQKVKKVRTGGREGSFKSSGQLSSMLSLSR